MISGAAANCSKSWACSSPAVVKRSRKVNSYRCSTIWNLARMSWPALLDHYNLHLDANDFTFVGRWLTPPFNARRFDTWFLS